MDGAAARLALRFRSARSVPGLGSASAGLAALAAAAQADVEVA